MKIIFFGTPDYVIPILDALKKAGYEIVAVVTQPPKPVGRKKVITPSPVAQWAKENRIPAFDGPPKTLVEPLKNLGTPLAVLAAYGRIIPQELIDIFPLGILNTHPSLLPKFRGATPVEAAIVTGEKQTGVTIIKLDAQLDHGPIISQENEDIRPEDTRITLRERLFKKGANLIIKVLPDYLEGKISPQEQNHDKATFTTLLKKDHGFIPQEYINSALQGNDLEAQWTIPFIKDFTTHPTPLTIHNFIRAVNPWPGAYTNVKLTIDNKQLEKRLKILKAHIKKQTQNTSGVGRVPYANPVGFDSSEVDGNTRLVLDLVQLEGKNPVTFQQFRSGYPNFSFVVQSER